MSAREIKQKVVMKWKGDRRVVRKTVMEREGRGTDDKRVGGVMEKREEEEAGNPNGGGG